MADEQPEPVKVEPEPQVELDGQRYQLVMTAEAEVIPGNPERED